MNDIARVHKDLLSLMAACAVQQRQHLIGILAKGLGLSELSDLEINRQREILANDIVGFHKLEAALLGNNPESTGIAERLDARLPIPVAEKVLGRYVVKQGKKYLSGMYNSNWTALKDANVYNNLDSAQHHAKIYGGTVYKVKLTLGAKV